MKTSKDAVDPAMVNELFTKNWKVSKTWVPHPCPQDRVGTLARNNFLFKALLPASTFKQLRQVVGIHTVEHEGLS